jgi:hypothetical protein
VAVNLARVLEECGLGDLDDDIRADLLKFLYTSLETRVSAVMSAGLSNEQLDQFERYYAAKNEEETRRLIFAWVPNHQQIVLDQVALLRAELTERAPEIRAVTDKREVRMRLCRRIASGLRRYHALRALAYRPWPEPDDTSRSARWAWNGAGPFAGDVTAGALVTAQDAGSVFATLSLPRSAAPSTAQVFIAYRLRSVEFDPPEQVLLALMTSANRMIMADESVLVRTTTVDGVAADVLLGPPATMQERPALVFVGHLPGVGA